MVRTVYAAVLAATLACSSHAFADNGSEYRGLYVFGDSLSDNGNIPRLTGVTYPPAPYFQSRFSNGPVYAEYLPGLLGFSAVGNNAVGGAFAGRGNTTAVPAGLPGTTDEIERFLIARPNADARDLFIVFAGANDGLRVLGAAATTPPAQVPALLQSSITSAITSTLDNLGRLTASGASQFVVPNLPDLGRTPSAIAAGPAGQQLASLFAQNYNAALAGILQQRADSVRIVPFDVAAIFNDLTTNPSRYGLVNVTQACVNVPSCVTGSTATQNQFLFWDTVHPTANVHAAIGSMMAHVLSGPAVFAGLQELGDVSRRQIEAQIVTGAGFDAASGNIATAQLSQGDRPLLLRVSGTYGNGSRDGVRGRRGFEYDTGSGVVALDWRVAPGWTVGAAIGVSSGSADFDLAGGKADYRSVVGAFHAAYVAGDFAASAYVDYARDEFRNIVRPVGAAGLDTRGETDGSTTGFGLSAKYAMPFGAVRVGPIGGVRYSNGRIDGYTETGLPFLAQIVDPQKSLTSVRGDGGGFLQTDLALGGAVLRSTLVATLEHDFQDTSRTLTSRIVSQSTIPTNTMLGAYDDTWGRVGATIELVQAGPFQASLGGSTTVGKSDGRDWAIGGRLGFRF
ncbi:autotransporter domain-containing protein [Roseiterribacter gracilis]|uniref:Lipase n=1 Tax=Roseiterribacter gracilis TaxID=2812848 RepID=A0A8S8XGR3_9PROT|nr:lipase [Rhodospirillales bacterium TMPK1]